MTGDRKREQTICSLRVYLFNLKEKDRIEAIAVGIEEYLFLCMSL